VTNSSTDKIHDREHGMVDFLSRYAAQDFLHLSLIAHRHGIIGSTIFLERLSLLARTGRPGDGAVVFANEILTDHEWPIDNDDGEHGASEQANDDRSVTAKLRERSDDDDDFIIHLMISAGGDNWIFHPGDDDFFPSIPHGHKKLQNLVKLDPYLGWKYERSKQCGRIKRKDIIAIWNDDRFRDMASTAVDYYLSRYPRYTGWSVANPRRIPRRRKK
jgi:hypothetical protein